MSYRHADHAGNAADVLKHAALAFCLRHLTKKDKPFRVIDTHAGAGLYRPEEGEHAKWRAGIGRVRSARPPEPVALALAPYLDAVEAAAADGAPPAYPGSSAIAAHLLRPGDALLAVEQDAGEHERLTASLAGRASIETRHADGYAALKSLLPPPERRGLVLLDPPFIHVDEMYFLAAAARDAIERWPTGVFLFWRPLTDVWAAERFDVGLAEWLLSEQGFQAEKLLRADMWTRELDSEGPLAGAGLVIVNPPYGLEEALLALLPWLAETLASGEGAGWRLDGALTDDSLTVDEF